MMIILSLTESGLIIIFENRKILSIGGIFYINIKASAFAELCSRNYVENTGDCYLLDQNDHIVFCEQKDLIGTDICDSFPLKNQFKKYHGLCHIG